MCPSGCIALFESAEALLSAFLPGAFDTIFLDIYMNGMSGMEAARKIRETDPHCALVFVTASMKYSLEAFSVFATTYVLKPITSEAMDAAFARCRDVFIKSARYIEVTSERQKFKIPLNRIQYVEMDGKSALFHTPLGNVKAYLTLDDAEAQLGGGPFLRCHRAFIVNMNHVENVLEQDILMRGGALLTAAVLLRPLSALAECGPPENPGAPPATPTSMDLGVATPTGFALTATETDTVSTEKELLNWLDTLDEAALAQYPVLYLVDGWEYYAGQLLSPQDFEVDPPAPTEYMFIGQYGGFGADETAAGSSGPNQAMSHGNASYRLTIEVPNEPRGYALELQEIFSAYRLYVNGELLMRMGEPGPASYRPQTGNEEIAFEASGSIDILIAVSDYTHFYSGMVYPPAFGVPKAMSSRLDTRFLI